MSFIHCSLARFYGLDKPLSAVRTTFEDCCPATKVFDAGAMDSSAALLQSCVCCEVEDLSTKMLP